MIKLIISFAVNFAALAIGGFLIGNPATNTWYQSVNKAPWTPPGWFFGFAWTTIMICYSIFIYKASVKFSVADLNVFYLLFVVQWLLNVVWNPVFFRFHLVFAGLVIILLLAVVVGWFLWWGWRAMGSWGLLVLPYFVWLVVASSLNAYIYFKN